MASKVLTDETGLQMVAALNKIAENQGGGGGGGFTQNSKTIEIYAEESQEYFDSLFWLTEPSDNETVIVSTNGIVNNSDYGEAIINLSLSQSQYDYLFNADAVENGLFEEGYNASIFYFTEVVSHNFSEGGSFDINDFTGYYVPSFIEIYSTSKKVKAAFSFSTYDGSPGVIYGNNLVLVSNFTYIRIAMKSVATGVYNATILSDGTIEEARYEE